MNNVIFVNATATRSSGALSILNQFIDNIPENSLDIYYLFVDYNFHCKNRINVIFVQTNTRCWIRRICWDLIGMKLWSKKNRVYANLIISLQNTGVFYKRNVKQLIYYHQLLPLSNHRWSIFRKDEIILFFYKYFYIFFVKLYLNVNSFFVVQIPSIKEGLVKKLKIKESKIFVIPPDITPIDYGLVNNVKFNDDCCHFIYPATPFVYKNHIILIKAISQIKKYDKELAAKIRIHFTFKETATKQLIDLIEKENVYENIIFEGLIPFEKLLSLYKSMNALLFPSYIETFGLPLIEAAAAGIPILVSDLPYSRDVVGEYEGAMFIKYNNVNEWSTAIAKLCNSKKNSIRSLVRYGESNWSRFFDLVDSLK